MPFRATASYALQEALNALEKYIAATWKYPPLIEVALIHYQFETIHPFLDGNGRLGRLLISLLLADKRLLPQPLLYLSGYFERNREEYMDLLLAVSQRGAWAEWVEFFLRGVARQSRSAVARSNELLKLRDAYRARAERLMRSATALRLVDLLFRQPAVTVSQVARELELTPRAASLNIGKMEKHKMLVEATGKDRNRIYIAPEIVLAIQKDDLIEQGFA